LDNKCPFTFFADNSGLPPSPWQCATGCTPAQITLTAGNAASGQATPSNEGVAEKPAGCQKMVLRCISQKPTSNIVVGISPFRHFLQNLHAFSFQFGSHGSVASKDQPFTKVRAQLFCVKDPQGGGVKWLRVGTTGQQNNAFLADEVG
jgi:hypothetical protein